MQLSRLVFPAPLGPMTPWIVPSRTERETPDRAFNPPKAKVTPSMTSELPTKRHPYLPFPWDPGGFMCLKRMVQAQYGTSLDHRHEAPEKQTSSPPPAVPEPVIVLGGGDVPEGGTARLDPLHPREWNAANAHPVEEGNHAALPV